MNNDIVKTIEELLRHTMCPAKDITIVRDEEIDLVKFVLELEGPNHLIGRNGETLRSLNYIVRKIIENKIKEGSVPNFLIDINNYHSKKIDEIKTKAKIIADRAVSFSRKIELEPMSAYDRLIVHSYLSKFPGVSTTSTGEGRERRVVVIAGESE